jgi:hypothetical protein
VDSLIWFFFLRPEYPKAYASLLLMCSEKAQNSHSALPALDAAVGFSQDFEDVISFDFSQSLKSCIVPRNLEITLAETDKVVIKNYKSGSADSLPIQLFDKNKEMCLFDLQNVSF